MKELQEIQLTLKTVKNDLISIKQDLIDIQNLIYKFKEENNYVLYK